MVVQDIFLTKTAELADVVLPGRRLVVRGRGHRHQLGAARAAHPQGARAAGRGPRRHVDPGRDRARASAATGAIPTAEQVWDEVRSLSPMHRGHALRPPGGARRHPVAVPRRGPSRARRSCTAALAGPDRGAAGAVLGRRAPAAVRVGRRRVPAAPHHRPAARVVQHRRADEPLPLAAAPRRVARPVAGGRRPDAARGGRDRPRLLAPRLRRGAGAHRPGAAARPLLHDVPLPRPGRLERAHDRRHRPEERHRRVQGRGGARGQDHAGAPAEDRAAVELPAEITGD